MKPNDFDLTMYAANIHGLINDLAGPLVALEDNDALKAMVGYIQVFAAQPEANGGYDLIVNDVAIQHFVLHAQRAGILDVEFFEESFESIVKRQVPMSPPIAPETLSLIDSGGGVVDAGSPLGNYADRYELQQRVSGVWTAVDQGEIGETEVLYQVTGLVAGTYQFRIVPRFGFFAGFPGASQSIEVS